jgi:hypothetical protein
LPWAGRGLVALCCALSAVGCADDELRRLGDPCAKASECASGRCDERVCKATDPAALGAPCSHPLDCRSERCLDGGCVQGTRMAGERCSDDLQCASGRCTEEVCEPSAADGGPVDAGPSDGAIADAANSDQGLPDAARPPSHLWTVTLGGTLLDNVMGIAQDPAGNLYLVGLFEEQLNLGGETFTATGADEGDIFLASLTADGVHRWSTSFGGPGRQAPCGVVIDTSGALYVAGNFTEAIDFGDNPLSSAGESDAFLASFDGSGTHRWSQRFGGAAAEWLTALALDRDDNVYVVGDFSSASIDFGGGALANAGCPSGVPEGCEDVYLAKFDDSGAHLWSDSFGASYSDKGWGIAIDPANRVFITGIFSDTGVHFNGPLLAFAGGTDIYLASYDGETMAHRWSKGFGGGAYDRARIVAVGPQGDVAIAGSFTSATLDFGGGTLENAQWLSGDLFVAVFDHSGGHRWSQRFGDTAGEGGWGLAVDAAGGTYVTGHFAGSLDLGGGELVSGGDDDVFFASFDADGTHRWSLGLGGSGDDIGWKTLVQDGAILLVGGFMETVDFGDGPETSAGSYDGFVTKFAP